MSVQPHKGRWQARVRTKDKYHRPVFETEQEAKAWESAAKLAISRGDPVPDPRGNLAAIGEETLRGWISEHFDYLWGGTKNEDNQRRLCNGIVEYFGADKLLSTIDNDAIEEWVDVYLDEECLNSDKTINRKLSALSKLLKHAHRKNKIKALPYFPRRHEKAGRTRFFTEHEIERMLDYFNRRGMFNTYHRVQFLLYVGCRFGESQKLTWDDVDGDQKVTFKDTKNGKPRTLLLPRPAREALRYAKAQGFPKPFTESYRTYNENWRAMRYKLFNDDAEVVSHVLRHTCASRLVQAGLDLARVQKWMGHEEHKTTLIYAHFRTQDLEVCAEVLDNTAPPAVRAV